MRNWIRPAGLRFAAHHPSQTPVLALALALLSISAPLAAQQPAPQPPGAAAFDVGATVQLQGCVVEGERKGTYAFSRVTAWPLAESPNGIYGPRHFWLSEAAQHLTNNVGRTIQVTGTIVEVQESEIERNPGYSSKGGERVAIELPGGDVITSIDLSGVAKSDQGSRVDMKITLLKVKVSSMLVVMQRCLPTLR